LAVNIDGHKLVLVVLVEAVFYNCFYICHNLYIIAKLLLFVKSQPLPNLRPEVILTS
jgi:hypothetical protein